MVCFFSILSCHYYFVDIFEIQLLIPAAAVAALLPKSPLCYGDNLCYGVSLCYGVIICYGVILCYGVCCVMLLARVMLLACV